jgi:hypothetical protein
MNSPFTGKAQPVKSRSLEIISASSWMLLAVCAVTLLFLAFTIPNVISMSRVRDREREVKQIRSSTDLHEVQEIAVWRTSEEAYVTEGARLLLILSVGALLFCMLCAGLNLLQVRRAKKELFVKDRS